MLRRSNKKREKVWSNSFIWVEVLEYLEANNNTPHLFGVCRKGIESHTSNEVLLLLAS